MKKQSIKVVVINREDWLTQAVELLKSDVFKPAGIDVHKKIRVSVGFMKNGATKRNAHKHTLGQCCPQSYTKDKVNEIILNIDKDKPLQMLATLAHEIIHAVDNNVNGHNHIFAGYMKKIGLEGIPTSTVAGKSLNGILKRIAKKLGKFPGKALIVPHNPADTRNIKLTCVGCCSTPLVLRASASQLLYFVNCCPKSQNTDTLVVEFKPKYKNNAFKSCVKPVQVPLDIFQAQMFLVKEKQGNKGKNGYYS